MNIKYKILIILSIMIWFMFLWLHFYNNREIWIFFSWNKNQKFSEYYIKKDKIYYRWRDELNIYIETLLTWSDWNSFKVIGTIWWFESYSKDKNNVWYNEILITGADAITFTLTWWFGIDKNYLYYWETPMIFLDRSTYQNVWQFFKDKNRVWVWFNNPYLPFSGNESGKNIIDIDAKSFKQVLCNNWLTDQYWNVVEVYVDKNRFFFDAKGLGASILFGAWTGFDYNSIECDASEIRDKYGMYAIIHGKNFWNITVLNRLHKL